MFVCVCVCLCIYKIVLQYDIIFIMEIRDKSQKVTPGFLKKVNR